MAKDDLAPVLRLVFGHEGGFTDNPKDPGNWSSGKIGVGFICGTKYGITGRTLGNARALGRCATLAEVKALTREEADTILREQYADPIRFADLPMGIDYATFDYCTNSGPVQAAKDLQRVLGVRVDGHIGINTIEAAAMADPIKTIDALCDRRLAFMKKLKGWPEFGAGWAVRVDRVRLGAVKMAQGKRPALAPPENTVVASSFPARPEDTVFARTSAGLVAIGGSIVSGFAVVTQAAATVAPNLTARLGDYMDVPGVKPFAAVVSLLGVLGLIGAAVRRPAEA